MKTNQLVVDGIYRHYKGNLYKVHGVVKHSETLEDLVLYEALYENKLGKMWVRPKEMFLGYVQVHGQEIPRFEYLEGERNHYARCPSAR